MLQSKNFRIQSTAKSLVEEDTLYLVGVANTGSEDLVGDIVGSNALEQICNQIPSHNLHMDHDSTIDGVLGPLVEGWIDTDGVHFKARVLNEKRELIQSYLEQGLNMGASISGVCEYEDGSTNDIATWQLTEISLTPIPCDQGTMGSVQIAKSFLDTVQAVQAVHNKSKTEEDEGENMAENEEITIEKVEELINTAFNEKQEDLIETVRSELQSEYDAAINELKERIETLESQGEESTEEKPAEEEGTSTPAVAEGESKADDEEEKPEEEDGDDKEDEEKSIPDFESMIEKAVQKSVKDIFNPKTAPSFQYEDKADNEESKKGYTPRELAEMLTQ